MPFHFSWIFSDSIPFQLSTENTPLAEISRFKRNIPPQNSLTIFGENSLPFRLGHILYSPNLIPFNFGCILVAFCLRLSTENFFLEHPEKSRDDK